MRRVPVLWLLALPLLVGFDLSRSSIPASEILSGGPPKDGIPALLAPKMVPAAEASFLESHDRVIGFARESVARAYPVRILNWHEVVNDVVGAMPIAVTYCPLTGSAVVFDRAVNGRTVSFGVSGRLYQSNVLLYDHRTESLWSQLRAEAVTGSETGTKLRVLWSEATTWDAWRRAHPETLVLSPNTGHVRDYTRNPYARYERSPDVMFPAKRSDRRLPAKERVLGVSIGGRAKAYPLARLQGRRSVEDDVGGTLMRIELDPEAPAVRAVRGAGGDAVDAVTAYWFAWSAFHPDTDVWMPEPAVSAPAGSATGSADVVVLGHDAGWTEVFGVGSGGDGGEAPSLFVIRGEVRNAADHPLGHVKLAFELLDAEGNVVAREEGYNRAAEILRDLDSPVPLAAVNRRAVRPLPMGGTDTFRMMFLRAETPAFHRYRIRVLDASAAQ